MLRPLELHRCRRLGNIASHHSQAHARPHSGEERGGEGGNGGGRNLGKVPSPPQTTARYDATSMMPPRGKFPAPLCASSSTPLPTSSSPTFASPTLAHPRTRGAPMRARRYQAFRGPAWIQTPALSHRANVNSAMIFEKLPQLPRANHPGGPAVELWPSPFCCSSPLVALRISVKGLALPFHASSWQPNPGRARVDVASACPRPDQVRVDAPLRTTG